MYQEEGRETPLNSAGGEMTESKPGAIPGDWMLAMLQGRDRIFHSLPESGVLERRSVCHLF